MGHAVIATFHLKEGQRTAFLAALEPLFAAAEREPGTLVYAVHSSERAPDTVWMYELYVDTAAFRVHATSEAMAAAMPAIEELLATPPEMVRCDVASMIGLPDR